ncbi:hypothetical protein RFM68_17720 [Mesorhizobium sp. MSK_1335]|uniref:Uncharacterized protein n=1 Tax=Mesorhizobium montanum TaxID=3072323 RepID=A0ABU4ZLV1_9HYPH|nr:hypothetical protein [Mesorhizobium sp. MSK_1335]MDX8526341.1 hypothetical protein [Mesorhizobium sp. MSK_1335]
MDVRNLIGSLSAALLRRRAAAPPIPVRVIRASLADVPMRPRPRPPHRPAPPIRPASNM